MSDLGINNKKPEVGFGVVGINTETSWFFLFGFFSAISPLESEATNAFAKCAYFYEDPNETSTFNEAFDTDAKGPHFFQVSTKEFWHLEGDIPSTVTLTWDTYSEINTLAEFLTDLKVVGWYLTQHICVYYVWYNICD